MDLNTKETKKGSKNNKYLVFTFLFLGLGSIVYISYPNDDNITLNNSNKVKKEVIKFNEEISECNSEFSIVDLNYNYDALVILFKNNSSEFFFKMYNERLQIVDELIFCEVISKDLKKSKIEDMKNKLQSKKEIYEEQYDPIGDQLDIILNEESNDDFQNYIPNDDLNIEDKPKEIVFDDSDIINVDPSRIEEEPMVPKDEVDKTINNSTVNTTIINEVVPPSDVKITEIEDEELLEELINEDKGVLVIRWGVKKWLKFQKL